jgi:predicted nucleic acid-binding protein
MPDSIFLDTNILVYAHDTGDPGKRQRCQELIFECLRNGAGVISAQVLSEFFVTITQKVKKPMPPAAAKKELLLLSTMRIVDIDATLVVRAIGIKERWQLSYWDALILAAAERAECKEVCSEDLSHGQVYGSVAVRNPFHGL